LLLHLLLNNIIVISCTKGERKSRGGGVVVTRVPQKLQASGPCHGLMRHCLIALSHPHLWDALLDSGFESALAAT